MKKLTILTIIFILSQIFAVNICLANGENKGGFLSGSAWMDNNSNNIQELDEANMADVIVFVQSAETGKLVTAKTNAAGFYTIDNLATGRYSVWSESITGATTGTQMVELGEVNGTAMLDMAFATATIHTEAPSFNIFLPIVNN